MSEKRKQPSLQLRRRRLPDDIIFGHLPNDIIFEILQRLPVNSLLRFTSVSKSWKASIKNSSFISSNHHHHHGKSSCSHLVFIPHPYIYSVQTCSLIPETSASTLTPIPNCNPILEFNANNLIGIVGSCEGLICFRSTSVFYIWNPFIRSSLKIPLDTEPKRGDNDPIPLMGFGFAPKSRDHRVVKLIRNDHYFMGEVEIYSLASNSWRRIKPLLTRFTSIKTVLRFSICVCLNGSLYWMVELWGNERGFELILRFDLEEERLEEIAAPSSLECPFSSNLGYSLAVIKGYLVLWSVSIAMENTINVQAHIYRKSNSGSSFWAAVTAIIICVQEGEEIMFGLTKTQSGHITVRFGHKGMLVRILVIDTYCDGENLSFKGRDLDGVRKIEQFLIIPTTKTLFLLDKK